MIAAGSVRTTAVVPDGKTLLICGTKFTEYKESGRRLPVLSDLPGVGGVFRGSTSVKGKPRTLMIMVKPLINPRQSHVPELARRLCPGRRQPDADHFFDKAQLYDLENDPRELRNLAGDSRYSDILADMKRRLREYRLDLPGTFAEFKTIDECPAPLKRLITQAKIKPLIPINTKRRITDKMPRVIRK